MVGPPIPTFIWVYLGVALLIFAGALAYRRRVLSRPVPYRAPQLLPQPAAYLNNGERTAVYTSLAALRCADAIGLTPGRRLTAHRPLPAPATSLDHAIYEAAERGVPLQELRDDPAVQAAVADLKGELERAGLLLDPRTRWKARRGAWLLLALLAAGVVRFATGSGAGVPVGYLGGAILAVVAMHLYLIARIPRRSRAGDMALAELYRGNRYLAPARRPAFDVYGPRAAGMAVALYGTAALWTLDRAMAEEAGIEGAALSTGPTGAPGASSSCGGGSGGCGGGGGGGGCGGGGGGGG